VIDELNRSNFDRAFGQLFTVLAGQAVVLPFKRKGQPHPLSITPAGVDAPPDTDVIRLASWWRIIATINVFDKNLLFEMSYALMRRFAFIEVTAPPEGAFRTLLEGPGSMVQRLLPLRELRDLGPAVYLDAGRYAARRLQDGVSESRVLFEVVYAYFLPQFEGVDDLGARKLYDMLSPELDDEERAELRRTVESTLGVELPA
jgi:hypothetical protein